MLVSSKAIAMKMLIFDFALSLLLIHVVYMKTNIIMFDLLKTGYDVDIIVVVG